MPREVIEIPTDKYRDYGIRKNWFSFLVPLSVYKKLTAFNTRKFTNMKIFIQLYNGTLFLIPSDELVYFYNNKDDFSKVSKWAHDISQPLVIGSKETINSLLDLEAIQKEVEKAKAIIAEVNNELNIRELRKWAIEQAIKLNIGPSLPNDAEKIINYIQNGNGKTTG